MYPLQFNGGCWRGPGRSDGTHTVYNDTKHTHTQIHTLGTAKQEHTHADDAKRPKPRTSKNRTGTGTGRK